MEGNIIAVIPQQALHQFDLRRRYANMINGLDFSAVFCCSELDMTLSQMLITLNCTCRLPLWCDMRYSYRQIRQSVFWITLICGFIFSGAVGATAITQTIEVVKLSVVGVGTIKKTRSPAISFSGTGFAVDDGLTIVTNAHVVPEVLDTENNEKFGIVVGKGEDVEFRPAVVIAKNVEHDLAILSITGNPLPTLKLSDSNLAKEGESFLFTGFPLGMVLGLHHATHRAMLAAITPVVMPAINSHVLDAKMVAQLRKTPFAIFQLDGTAYPGNSGSPLYDGETGQVFGVINMVLVKGLKETAISQPSGISYAIPSNFVTELLQQRAK